MRALAIPLTLGLVLAGCLGAEEPVTPGTASTNLTNSTKNATAVLPAVALEVATTGIYPINPAFDKATLEAKEGANVTITLTNGDQLPFFNHDWVLEGVDGAATEAVAAGETTSVSFIAPAAGEYAYFCSVGDHRDRGMAGTLTVTA